MILIIFEPMPSNPGEVLFLSYSIIFITLFSMGLKTLILFHIFISFDCIEKNTIAIKLIHIFLSQ